MSIEKARDDLARIEAERVALSARLRDLDGQVVKIANYIELAAVYGPSQPSQNVSAVVEHPKTAARPGGAGPKLPLNVRQARAVLLERKRPTHTKILVDELARRSITIGGKNPITNLSSALSRFKETFISDRSEGWSLVEWHKPSNADTASEPTIAEPLVEEEMLGEDDRPLSDYERRQWNEFEAERTDDEH